MLSRIGAANRVLDFGCGVGILTTLYARHCPDTQFVGVDRSPGSIAAASPETPAGTGLAGPGSRAAFLNRLLAAAGNAFGAACLDALLTAQGVPGFPSYRDICPSAFTSA